LIMQH